MTASVNIQGILKTTSDFPFLASVKNEIGLAVTASVRAKDEAKDEDVEVYVTFITNDYKMPGGL